MKKETRNIIISICGIFVLFGFSWLYFWYRGEFKEKEEPMIRQDQLLSSEDDVIELLLNRESTASNRAEFKKWLHGHRLYPHISTPNDEIYNVIRRRAKELSKSMFDDFISKNNKTYPGWCCPFCGQTGWLLVEGKYIHVYKCLNGHLWER